MKIWACLIIAAVAAAGQAHWHEAGNIDSPSLPNMPALAQSGDPIKHAVNDDRLFIECIVPRADFSLPAGKGAVALLYIDGSLHSSYHSPAFFVKGLSPGEHEVHVKIIDGDKKLIAENRFSAYIR